MAMYVKNVICTPWWEGEGITEVLRVLTPPIIVKRLDL